MKYVLALVALLSTGTVYADWGDFINRLFGSNGQAVDALPAAPEHYFPMEVGRRFVYDITLGEAEPLGHSYTIWSTSNDKGMLMETRSRVGLESAPQHNQLIIRVLATAEEQGLLHLPKGVELEIEKDTLGIFGSIIDKPVKFFWAVADPERSHDVYLVTVLDPTAVGAPTGSWGAPVATAGYELRRLFTADLEPGHVVNTKKMANEQLLYVGHNHATVGGAQKDCVSFVRIVKKGEDHPSTGEPSVLDKPFTETMLYCKGAGLVSLVQRIGEDPLTGQMSMTWTLVQ